MPWRPRQLILLVNEQTLLPVLMPLAQSAPRRPESAGRSPPRSLRIT
ncbi:hypothetical protein [Paractinoplanes durhamensis]